MCTGKRQTHIRNAPSSRTAVTGIGPYRVLREFAAAHRADRGVRPYDCLGNPVQNRKTTVFDRLKAPAFLAGALRKNGLFAAHGLEIVTAQVFAHGRGQDCKDHEAEN